MTAYLDTQRALTAALIATDPTTVSLVPRTQVATPGGGWTYAEGTPRAAQIVKLVLLNADSRGPETTVAGVERRAEYHLVGPWDMAIAVGDLWEAPDGTRWEVISFTEGWGYMTKALLSRHIPRGVRP